MNRATASGQTTDSNHTPAEHAPSEKERAHFLQLLHQFHTAMLVTHESEDRLRARPMAVAKIEDDGKLWFLTDAENAKAHEIERDTRVHIVCQQGMVSQQI